MQPTRSNQPEEARQQSIEPLNRHLVAAIDLHGLEKQAHWSMRGPALVAIHGLLHAASIKQRKIADAESLHPIEMSVNEGSADGEPKQ